jgi:hypothetical protein
MITRQSRRGQSSGSDELLDVQSIMRALASRRPVFHSEADFQHEFAILLREKLPDCQIRLEKPFGYQKGGATDIVLTHNGSICGIELKYLTKRLVCELDGEMFQLKAHGATDLRRYDVMKDAARLEAFNAVHGGTSYVIALTNDPAYWRPTNKQTSIDAAFRLCEGRKVSGELHWTSHASAGSIKGREIFLQLKNEYQIAWHDYWSLPEGAATFKYLSFEVR